MQNQKPTTIDQYIAAAPAYTRDLLSQMRAIIKAAAPQATEDITYAIPTFKLNGKNLVHFAGYPNHIGFYPAPEGIDYFELETAKYKKGKGTLQFALNMPLPVDLITEIVQFRVEVINLKNKK